jgi:hypothetical protein
VLEILISKMIQMFEILISNSQMALISLFTLISNYHIPFALISNYRITLISLFNLISMVQNYLIEFKIAKMVQKLQLLISTHH